jgi:hypothetical protein
VGQAFFQLPGSDLRTETPNGPGQWLEQLSVTAQILNNDEAARLIGVTPNTLKFWRYKGKGPRFLKFGESKQSGVGYDPVDIEAWKAERKFASTTAYSPAAHPSVKHNIRR